MNIKKDDWKDNRPHDGKVFAAIFPHSDDFTFNACGLILKLIHEGYTGYFIRMTDDCMDSYDLSYGETALRIEKETDALVRLLRVKKLYNFNYNNHYMGHDQIIEMRHRLMLIFRFLKVDTVISFDPYGRYEENPDHEITGKAVEQACWMAGRQSDMPETKDMGLAPHFVHEKYYYARGPQETNLVIDITTVLDIKRRAIKLHATPLDNMWKVYLERHGGISNPEMSFDEFVRVFFTERVQEPCEGLTHYEKFRYIGE